MGARTEEEVADAAEVEEAEADWSSLDGRAVAARRGDGSTAGATGWRGCDGGRWTRAGRRTR